MVVINDFSGGLKNRIFKTDMQPLFARKYENINHSRLALIPSRLPKLVDTPILQPCRDDGEPEKCSNNILTINTNSTEVTSNNIVLKDDTIEIDQQEVTIKYPKLQDLPYLNNLFIIKDDSNYVVDNPTYRYTSVSTQAEVTGNCSNYTKRLVQDYLTKLVYRQVSTFIPFAARVDNNGYINYHLTVASSEIDNKGKATPTNELVSDNTITYTKEFNSHYSSDKDIINYIKFNITSADSETTPTDGAVIWITDNTTSTLEFRPYILGVIDSNNKVKYNFDTIVLIPENVTIKLADNIEGKLVAIPVQINMDYTLNAPRFKTIDNKTIKIDDVEFDNSYDVTFNDKTSATIGEDDYSVDYVEEEYEVTESITYTLEWERRAHYSPLYRDTRYNIFFVLFKEDGETHTYTSNFLPLVGQYINANKHNLNLNIKPRFNQRLYDLGFTKIKFFLAYNNIDSSSSLNINWTKYKVVVQDGKELFDYVDQPYTFGQIILGNFETNLVPREHKSCLLPFNVPDQGLVIDCCQSSGFTNSNEQGHFIALEVSDNGEYTNASDGWSFFRDSTNTTYKVGTRYLNNYKYHELYMFIDNDWRLLWEGTGNAPMRGTLQNHDKLLPIPCPATHTQEFTYTKTKQVPILPPQSSCSELVSYDNMDKWYYSENLRQIIPLRANEYAIDYLRYTIIFGQNNLIRRFNSSHWYSLSIEPPKLSIPSFNNGNQKFKFVTTFYNSAIDIESGPSNIVEIEAGFGTFTLDITLPQLRNFDKHRVYVLTDDLLGYTLIDEYRVDQSRDTNKVQVTLQSIDSIVGNRVLDKFNANLSPQNLKYPIITAGIIAGAVENKLYFSEQGRPESWPAANYIEFTQDITGIGKTNQGIVVFTKEESYIIVGTSVKTFAKYLLSAEIGCINGDTVCEFNNGIAFASYHGIYWTNGGTITSLTEKALGKLYLNGKTRYAAVANNKYAITLDTDDIFELDYYNVENKPIILEIDSRFNTCIKTNDEQAKFIGPINDELFITKQDNNIYQLYPRDTDKKIMHYLSSVLVPFGYSINKVYKDVFISYKAPIRVIIRGYDNSTQIKTMLDINLPSDKTQYNAKLKNGYNLYGLEIEVIGSGEVYEISFNTKDRT